MTQVRSAKSAISRLRDSGTPGWLWFAPGDATRYHVHLIRAQSLMPGVREAATYTALLVQVQTSAASPMSVIVQEPPEYDMFSLERWLDLGLPEGWWPGVRPLLANLGWCKPGFDNPEFDESDRDALSLAVADRQRVRKPIGWR